MKWYLAVALFTLLLVGCSSGEPADQSASGSNTDADTITTASGLRYEDLAIGSGEQAKTGVGVAVHYTGWLEDGTKFDSSLDRGEPFTFQLGASQVIKGWDEGVANMRVGGKRRLTIPADLAYGDRGSGRLIPPGATLVFEVELMSIQPAAQPTAQPTVRPTAQPPAASGNESNENDESGDASGSIITTASGLQYEDLELGTGKQANAGMGVSVHYTGWLVDGAKFDSSLDRGEPFTFKLGASQVIKGWDEGVANMLVGGKRRLTIPADLAYGDRGAGSLIPPGATLIFEVELLAIQ